VIDFDPQIALDSHIIQSAMRHDSSHHADKLTDQKNAMGGME